MQRRQSRPTRRTSPYRVATSDIVSGTVLASSPHVVKPHTRKPCNLNGNASWHDALCHEHAPCTPQRPLFWHPLITGSLPWALQALLSILIFDAIHSVASDRPLALTSERITYGGQTRPRACTAPSRLRRLEVRGCEDFQKLPAAGWRCR
jgi:hypothetical protein